MKLPLVFLIALSAVVVGCRAPEKKVPPVYISIKYPGDKKIDSLIKLMTLEEKVSMIHAASSFTTGSVTRLNIPAWIMSDGPHGVRKEHGTDYTPDEGVNDSCTYLPVGVALASTWNASLAYQYGTVLGREAKFRGKDVILGPGVNIIRTPLNGRNFEYFSEDPHLTSQLAVNYIRGVQDQDVSACVKHFIANNQEINRTSVSVEMDDRTLHEIYLPAFKASVQEGKVNLVMGSYNKFRGQYCTHHDHLINTILKNNWKFPGVLISDWGSVHSTEDAVHNGTDVEMGTDLFMQPDPDYGKFFLGDEVIRLVKSGNINEQFIDDKVRRILRVMYKTNLLAQKTPGAINTFDHQQIALKVAEEGIVLLKNDGILPLQRKKIRTIAVIGANATRRHAASGGSSQVNAKYEITPLEGIRKIAGGNIQIRTAAGYEIKKDGPQNSLLRDEAVSVASNADVVLYVGGWIHGYSDAWDDNAFDSETLDKASIALPFEQDALIQAIKSANPNIVTVLYGGGPTDMSAWNTSARAIIQAWYPGMEGGTALAKIVFGDINPSGKLPMTFPEKLHDSPAHAMGEYPGTDVVNYNEGLLVGYRYFDTKDIAPLYPFGHGLSYSRFELSDLSIQMEGNIVGVSLLVSNKGALYGGTVVQVYIRDEQASLPRPDKELKGFEKIFLGPYESRRVTLLLPETAFQYYNDSKDEWLLEPGKFFILVGNSSKDIRLTGEIVF